MNKKYTIMDIAELAGVSKGTVDRVLHQRGKVSSKSQEQVEKILKEIDYQPNPIARNLKNNKVYRISVILPDPKHDAYWKPAVQGIQDAIKEFKPFGVEIDMFYYNPLKQVSFVEKSKEVLALTPDAILMAPQFQNEALAVFKQCREKEVLVALFNNVIEAFNTQNYIGQDSHQTGQVAAGLIHKLVDHNSTIAVLHIDKETHMNLKEDGFKQFFKGKTKAPQIETFSLQTTDIESFEKSSIALVKSTKNISAVFVTNSKTYAFLNAIGDLRTDLVVIGYDLLEENIKFLRKDRIDYLIHQKPKQQAYLGVGHLAEHFLFGKPIPAENLLPIDIITTENVSYYLD
jgi:LacI family transcriptional regulator